MGAETDEAQRPDGAGLSGGGPSIDPASGAITFVVRPEGGATPRSLWYHLRHFGSDPTLRPDGTGSWTATIPRPPVDRLEYLVVVRGPDGAESMVVDGANPLRVEGPFGPKSVLELPGYHPPSWLSETSVPWTSLPFSVPTGVDGTVVAGELLTPPGSGPEDPLPLLVVHDGPEYSRLARLGDYLAWLGAASPALRCRALLLQPVDRDLSYAASAPYTETLVEQALPRVRELAPTVGPVVGLGASLGALALAHAAATYPGAFGGLVCQSGSFFLPAFDAHERRFRYYHRVVTAVARLHAAPPALSGLEITLTSGTGEENLDNNLALASRLRELGLPVVLVEGRDGHNHTAWRDLLDPALGDLLARVWRNPGALQG